MCQHCHEVSLLHRRKTKGGSPMSRIASFLPIAAASILVLSSAGCESESKPPPEAPETTGAAAPATTASTAGDTFGTLRAIHKAEIDHGTLALQKAQDPRVKAVAQKVVADHKARMAKDDKITGAIGITPRDNSVSKEIANAADAETDRLYGVSGDEFDRAYIDGQVSYYRTALDVFDRRLLPNIKDPDV